MKRLCRLRRTAMCVLLAIMAVGGVVINSSPAGATIVQNQDWIQGYPMANVYTPAGYMCTSGPMFYATSNAHYYMAIPRHCVEYQLNDGSFMVNNNSAGVCCTVAAKFMDDPNNYFTVGNTLVPWGVVGGIDFRTFDMALVDLGWIGSAVAGTPLIHNWCHAYPNCAGPTGGGTGQATFGQGYNMHTVDQGTPWVGALSCHSGRQSGTACGYISQAVQVTVRGYTSWVWKVDGIGNCGAAAGDSGMTTYWTEDAQNVYPFGMGVVGFDQWQTTSQNSCYSAGRTVSTSIGFIPWTSIRDGFTGLGLYPITG